MTALLDTQVRTHDGDTDGLCRHCRAPLFSVDVSSEWQTLTPAEREVVDEVCEGRSNPDVALRLGISRRTVEAHLRSIYAKVGVSNRLALVVRARRL